MAERTFTINALNAVSETLKQTSCDALIARVQRALHLEKKRARGRVQTNPKVRRALMQEREIELADYARRNAREAAARKQNERGAKTIEQTRAEQEVVHQRRLELQRASTVAECLTALKSYELQDLGQGHLAGGSAEHVKNRMNVLDRIKQKAAPLPPELANDWGRFKKHWDRYNLQVLLKEKKWFGHMGSKGSVRRCSPKSKRAITTP